MNEFEQNQSNMKLPNARVIWCGDYVSLHDGANPAGNLFVTPAKHAIESIKRWCVLNNYRCEQIRNNIIWI